MKGLRRLFLVIFPVALLLLGALAISGCTEIPEPEPPPLCYEDFGAVGDGETDDFDAIIATHEEANKQGKKVKAKDGSVYYIGASNKTARIETDTNWGTAQFIIDDSEIGFTDSGGWRDAWVFSVSSALPSESITSVGSLTKNQEVVDIGLGKSAVVSVTDNKTKRYIRRGENQNSGANQTDVFVVDKNGNVDMDAPIIWDFENISSMTAYPIDTKQLTVKGGMFTTIANSGNADNNYMKRGIRVNRSNTVLDNIYHMIEGEGEQGAPYEAFVKLENCAYITIQNSIFTGHRGYKRPSQPSTTRGTYDINASRTVNMQLINCSQTNDYKNSYWWGIFTSNYSKNILFDNVQFSRFDAHQGVYNTTIRDSILGHQGVSIIGGGLLIIENTTVYGKNFIYFRDDYGSTWEGELYIKDCTFVPGSSLNSAEILHTNNDGQWNFGYECFMPETVTIDGFTVEDSEAGGSYNGVLLYGAVNNGGSEPHKFNLTKQLYIGGFNAAKPYRWPNTYLKNTIPVVAI